MDRKPEAGKRVTISDRPTLDDHLDFSRLAKALANSIRQGLGRRVGERQGHKDNQASSTTIGIYGEWGSGKTSFLLMVENELNGPAIASAEKIHTIWFDAWKYEAEDNLWAALLQTILNQVGKHGSWYRRLWVQLWLWRDSLRLRRGFWEVFKKIVPLLVRALIIMVCLYIVIGIGSRSVSGFTERVVPGGIGLPPDVQAAILKVFTVLIGVIVADPFKLISLLNGRLGIDFSQFQQRSTYQEHIAYLDNFSIEFQKLIHLLEPHKPLVIVIDDLDRCLPERAIKILEAIKIFLDVEGCIFLLALDKKMVERAVVFKYREMMAFENSKGERGAAQRKTAFYEDYIDKIIQIPILLPRLQVGEIENFVRSLSADQDLRTCAPIFGVALPPNPRRIKRVLRAFLFVMTMVVGEVKPTLLAKLIVIQQQFPDVYEAVTERPELLRDLERYFRRTMEDEARAPSTTQLLGGPEQQALIQQYAANYPELRRIFGAELMDGVLFAGEPLEEYIILIGAVAEVRTRLVEEALGSTTPPIWNVPFLRNPFFTGRQELLTLIHAKLRGRGSAATQALALNGMVGVGKTQLIVEYAYRYREEYRVVLWVNAATHDSLVSDFTTAASLLQLPERNVQNQNLIVTAVKHWLSGHTSWLLIFDNARDLAVVRGFFPTGGEGHILLIPQSRVTDDLITTIEIDTLSQKEGMLLLLRRAQLLGEQDALEALSEIEREQASQIVRDLYGLPLALVQAGAYIAAMKCSLADYVLIFQQQRHDALRAGDSDKALPGLGATLATCRLLLRQVADTQPAAIELLRFCALLGPEAIPEELITEGASELGALLGPVASEPGKLNEVLKSPLEFSLLRRDASLRMISARKMALDLLLLEMDQATRQLWAGRVIRVVNQVFPTPQVETWETCQRLLPQAQACLNLIREYQEVSPEAASILSHAGAYLLDRLQVKPAEPFCELALEVNQRLQGSEPLEVAECQTLLAGIYQAQGRYVEAEPLYEQALEVRARLLADEDPEVTKSQNNLAGIYQAQGKYAEAEPLYERGLEMREKSLGPNDPLVASSLSQLGALHLMQENYQLAERYYERALKVREASLGRDHPDLAMNLANLAVIYQAQERVEEAEHCYVEAVELLREGLGSDNPNVATTLNNLAGFYRDLERYAEAKPLYEEALKIFRNGLGENHPNVAMSLNNLAGLYQAQHEYGLAETMYKSALRVYEYALGPTHSTIAELLENYATLLWKQKRDQEARELEERASQIHSDSW